MNEAFTNSMMYYGFAIPGFFLLMGIEYLFDKIKKKKNYRLNDTITNISSGIGSSITSIFIKSLLIFLFTLAYNWAPYKIPSNIFTGFILLLLFDLAFYWAHRIGHEVNMFWAAHVVHHQSEEYNLSVALRQPWLMDLMTIFLFLPLPFMGFDPMMFVIVSATDALYQFGIHTKYIGKLPSVFEYVFNTPSHHRVHHSVNKQYIDKNYGGMFVIWDRLFGTFEKEVEEPIYGITQPFNSWNPVWANFHYWAELFKISKQTIRVKDKIKIFFASPGWFPDDMGGYKPPVALKKGEQIKFDIKIPDPLKLYVGIQYLVLLITAILFINFQGKFSLIESIWPSIMILVSTISIGALLESKDWAKFVELLRLFGLVLLVGYTVFVLQFVDNIYFYITIIYLMLSLFFFYLANNSFNKQELV